MAGIETRSGARASGSALAGQKAGMHRVGSGLPSGVDWGDESVSRCCLHCGTAIFMHRDSDLAQARTVVCAEGCPVASASAEPQSRPLPFPLVPALVLALVFLSLIGVGVLAHHSGGTEARPVVVSQSQPLGVSLP